MYYQTFDVGLQVPSFVSLEKRTVKNYSSMFGGLMGCVTLMHAQEYWQGSSALLPAMLEM
jgi:hypothetical protein